MIYTLNRAVIATRLEEAVVDQEDDKTIQSGGTSTGDTPATNLVAQSIRRAQIEMAGFLQEAYYEYQTGLAAAFSRHQEELKKIAHEFWGNESAALESLRDESKAGSGRTRINEIRRQAFHQTQTAARKLAEEQQQLWFDNVEKQQGAYTRYAKLVDSTSESAGLGNRPVTSSTFGITADEVVRPTVGTFGITADEVVRPTVGTFGITADEVVRPTVGAFGITADEVVRPTVGTFGITADEVVRPTVGTFGITADEVVRPTVGTFGIAADEGPVFPQTHIAYRWNWGI
jgi:hypothetical protein